MKNKLIAVSAFSALLVASVTAGATEDGQSHADLGYIDTLAGLPLAPGFYVRDDVNFQSSGRFNNGSGNGVSLNLGQQGSVGLKFRNTVEADILSIAYVPDYKIPYINATVGAAAYEFYANSNAGLSSVIGVPQASGKAENGFSDITVVPLFLGFDVPGTDFHFVFSPLEFTAPTGKYSRNQPIGNNIGLNYWSYRPALEMTYLNKTGQEFDINMSTSINSQNQATHYKSGDEFYFTYAFQQYLSPQLAFGIGGYYYKQVGNDTVNGQTVNTNTSAATFDTLGEGVGNKGETFAIGPIISYNISTSIALQAHWDHEVFSFDRPQRDQVYARAAVKF